MNYKMDFVKHRKFYYLFSIVLVIAGTISLFVQGLNLGIDFVSGTRLDFAFPQKVDQAKAEDVLQKAGLENTTTRIGGQNKEVLIVRLDRTVSSTELEKYRKALDTAFQTKVSVQEQVVNPIIGRELARNAIISILLASLIIVAYVAIRFKWRYAVAAIAALFYDALFTIGIFSLFQFEVDLVFIAAILTIVGYSVNDTIVIFDRIRENMILEKPKKLDHLKDIVNRSLNQTLVRSLNTVISVLLGALALFVFGGESIRYFSLALLLGLISGSYSSIFLASQLWLDMEWASMKKGPKKEKLDAIPAE
ncbi:protein translocase subunit SecF [Risungbinella massiliensis]|uniref:protein translocase subunit SecF n=1 Tax=Risungbinella massiliensis TaxID=1329796 RepID=UPI00069936F8|nr:protein translocase subunit SecF [Risungbinella massiliensis]